jgi:hypothetical protein
MDGAYLGLGISMGRGKNKLGRGRREDRPRPEKEMCWGVTTKTSAKATTKQVVLPGTTDVKAGL